jgi:hypothetical protein
MMVTLLRSLSVVLTPSRSVFQLGNLGDFENLYAWAVEHQKGSKKADIPEKMREVLVEFVLKPEDLPVDSRRYVERSIGTIYEILCKKVF